MTDPVQILSVGVSAGLLVLVLELVRRHRLTEEYSLVWIASAAGLLVLSLWRHGLDLLAARIGIFYPPALLILALALFVFVICLSFSLAISRQRQQIERLVEDVALLDAELRELRDSVGAGAAADVVPGAATEGNHARHQRRVG
jgi:hypothetical protein